MSAAPEQSRFSPLPIHDSDDRTTSSNHSPTNVGEKESALNSSIAHADSDHQAPVLEPSTKESLLTAVTLTWLNFLLVCIPIGWTLYLIDNIEGSDKFAVAAFGTGLASMIPLSRLLGFISEDLALRFHRHPGLGRLLIVSSGNVIEIIIGITFLVDCNIAVVQTSLVGAIISNLLLVLGSALFRGGLSYSQQGFGGDAAKLSSSILMVSVIAILIPATMNAAVTLPSIEAINKGAKIILSLSHGLAIVLLLTYFAYLAFQLLTHRFYYYSPTDHIHVSADDVGAVPRTRTASRFMKPHAPSAGAPRALADQDHCDPELNMIVSLALLFIVTACLTVSVLFVARGLENVHEVYPHVKKDWIGLIIIPMVSNGSEQLSSLENSAKDRIDFVMSVAIGKSIQLALFVIPLLVLISWAMHSTLSLLFDPFIAIILFLSVLITTYTIQNGKSTWFDGFLLLVVWTIIAISFWFYPSDNLGSVSSILDDQCVGIAYRTVDGGIEQIFRNGTTVFLNSTDAFSQSMDGSYLLG